LKSMYKLCAPGADKDFIVVIIELAMERGKKSYYCGNGAKT